MLNEHASVWSQPLSPHRPDVCLPLAWELLVNQPCQYSARWVSVTVEWARDSSSRKFNHWSTTTVEYKCVLRLTRYRASYWPSLWCSIVYSWWASRSPIMWTDGSRRWQPSKYDGVLTYKVSLSC
jgi:hypothetical protein